MTIEEFTKQVEELAEQLGTRFGSLEISISIGKIGRESYVRNVSIDMSR